MNAIDLDEKLGHFSDHWSPRIIAALNGQEVKLAKFIGAFDWHSHPDEDEMFLVLHGSFTMEFRKSFGAPDEYGYRSVELHEGQMLVVPKGVEHRPVAEQECSVMLVEPVGLVNTGDADENERTTTGTWI
ncbi:MAG: cupin domain-containing protein [Phycisphaera sp. TMED9]|nr:MAG: cupin domain-containing protein [Phycisphaera sp. TMED9]